MGHLQVLILASDQEQRASLQALVDGTSIARVAGAFAKYPASSADESLKKMEVLRPDVILVDLLREQQEEALRAIGLLRSATPNTVIFASGDVSDPALILAALRAGAGEFLERPANKTSLLEALVRVASSAIKASGASRRGKIITFLNAKGGCGATTIAVNTALALQAGSRSVALVDMAVLGHAALHLNVKPAFTVADAARNLQRLDSTLLQQFMVRCGDGLQFLAAPEHSESLGFAQPGIQQIVDVLAGGFEYVLVDLSTRLDLITSSMAAISDRVLITAHADVPSLWSASRIRKTFTFQSEEQVQLVLNRFEKIPGFSDSEIEAATNMRLFWKVPNQYEVVSQAVNRGTPVVMQKNLEITKSFAGLAEALATQGSEKRRATSLFAFTH